MRTSIVLMILGALLACQKQSQESAGQQPNSNTI